jgi:hypothetical protein
MFNIIFMFFLSYIINTDIESFVERNYISFTGDYRDCRVWRDI